MSSRNEIEALKVRVRTIKVKLHSLEKRIREVEQGSNPSAYIAFVDPNRCVGCGTCREFCPAWAICLEETAQVDPKRCTGCGHCVEQCPMGALTLQPLNTGYRKEFRGAR